MTYIQTARLFFFFLSMFILKISDKKIKDVLKKKATLKGGGVFGQQLKTYLNGRGTEGKRIQLFLKNSNYESVPRLLCLFLSMCASGLSIFESVWNNFFFKNKISKSSNWYLPSSWEQSALFHFLLFFLVYLYIVIFWCISFQWLNFYLRFGLFQSNNEKNKQNKRVMNCFLQFFPSISVFK